MGEDDRTPNYPGLSEEDFGRLERVRMMDDAALLDAWRKLSNARVVTASPWLPFIEAEIRERGLLPPN